MINPIFSSALWDYQVIDRIFCSYMTTNPYKPTTLGKTPTGGAMPWMAYDWNYYIDTYTGYAVVELWFRDDILWHDGVQFTVADLNYTIYLHQVYEDSYGHSEFMHVTNFVEIDDFHCLIYFDWPSMYSLYTCAYDIVPKHIYEQIPIRPYPETGGHRGYWPGQDEGFTPEQTLIGTNMWEYLPGSLVEGVGGGITLDAYDGFWMQMVPGDIDFQYFWNAGTAPQGGKYTIGLSDLVLFANAYGTEGYCPVPFVIPGPVGVWNPAADLAAPSCVIGLSDLVTLAKNYGDTWGQNP
jgi:hypothetical protein